MTQHAGLTEEKWATFTLDQQILMIANEMNRASVLVAFEDLSRARNCYERVLHLTDLTVRTQTKSTLRGELLRWRDLVAELYLSTWLVPTSIDARSDVCCSSHPRRRDRFHFWQAPGADCTRPT